MSESLLHSSVEERVAVVRLKRPKVLNALSLEMMAQLADVLERLDSDPDVRCIVLTGDERAFAAGADINDMADASVATMYERNQFARWERIKRIRTPIIAAVSGYCLGGGCELAMHCDIIIASETARFAQPEINIGVMPGAGGTQRLTRALGKFRAMELILTGRQMTAREAYDAGLVTRVVPVEIYLDEAVKLAREIGQKAPLAVRLAKEAVLKAWETSLSEGLEYERKLFYLLFGTEDQREGMKAFLEKRPAAYRGR
ncbi:MAG: enoyl-CoA hydratase-related protein [Phycisphaerae bacterium]|nr:enoyl-CoA hydratase-related protein [Phycisphaerae bacterium]